MDMRNVTPQNFKAVGEWMAAHETATCPDCGGTVNPKVLEFMGRCTTCHTAKLRAQVNG